jgi:3-hydroxyisobutyrate dehydrogenase-like beta-hydroxyacid dehydrogenase
MRGRVGLGVNPNANRWLAVMTSLVRVPRIGASRSRTDPKRRGASTARRTLSKQRSKGISEMTAKETKGTPIGFVGLGHMGGNMAARLLAAGYPVSGEATRREAAQHLVDEGLSWRTTPREVAQCAEIVFTSLPDDDVLEEVASGPDGILAGLTAGTTWVDVSTVSPRASRELAERVRGTGALMLDAPVSGSVPQVQSGTLTIMVGGDRGAYEGVEPVLRELGTPTHVGANGQGLMLKLAINISLAVQVLALSEGLLIAERDGVDRELALEVMTQSPIGSPMLKARAPLVLDLPEDAWFDIGLMHKDIRLALEAAAELNVPVPSARAADEVLTEAGELGYEHRDIAAIFEVLGKVEGAPGTRMPAAVAG